MKCTAALIFSAFLVTTIAAAKTGQLSPPSLFPVWEHNHRCDYRFRPRTDPNGRVEQRIWTYKDVDTGITLQVESDGRLLHAVDSHGHVLWRRDPHQGVPPYQVDPACIFAIGLNSYDARAMPKSAMPSGLRGKPVMIQEGKTGHYVFLEFDNSQFGAIDVKSGDFYFWGQN